MTRAPDEAEPAPPAPALDPGAWRILAWPLAIVPGLGPLLRGRVTTALLLLACTGWIRLMLAGHAPSGERVEAFAFGALGIGGGLGKPTVVFLTLIALATHLLAVRATVMPQELLRPRGA